MGACAGRLASSAAKELPPILLEDKGEPLDVFKRMFNQPGFGSIEIITTLFFGIALFFLPLSIELFFVLAASCLLIVCFATDYEHGILPDQLTLSLMWLGLLASLSHVFISPEEAIQAAALGYGIFWLINFIYKTFRGFDGMFPGDFKLNAGIGACLGLQGLGTVVGISFILLISFAVFQLISQRNEKLSSLLYKEIPYGCFASIVAIAYMILALYLNNIKS